MSGDIDIGSLKILVIDDQEFVRTIVRKMLGQIGIGSVFEAPDAQTGLDLVASERPHVVICDVQMRPIDGFGFVRELRALAEAGDTPVILLTAHTDATTLARARDLRIGAFLSKPVLPPALKDKIVQVVSGAARPV